MLTSRKLIEAIRSLSVDTEIRIADVAEQDDLHCSVGRVVFRNGCIILVPGDDQVWKDETLASLVRSETLWPEEDDSED